MRVIFDYGVLLGAARIRAVQHRFPIFGPGLAPAHAAAAHGAKFAWQKMLVTFEISFHANTFRKVSEQIKLCIWQLISLPN